MPETDIIHMRVSSDVKKESDSIFGRLGMTTTDAINIFLSQVILHGGLPFEVKLPTPNEVTLMAMRDAENNKDIRRFNSPDEMFKELNI